MTKYDRIKRLTDVDIEAVSKDDLVDMSGFVFDNTVPQAQRAERLLEAAKNPYCFRVGNVGVKLEFSDDAPALHDVFTNFLIRLKTGL